MANESQSPDVEVVSENPRVANAPGSASPTPYRDSDDVESTPLLQGEEPYRDDPTDESPRRLIDEEQPALTTNENPSSTPDQPRRRFNYVLFHRITLNLAIILALYDGTMAFVVYFLGPDSYNLPYSVLELNQAILWTSLFTVAWASSNLIRHRKSQTLMPHIVGTLVHGWLATWLFGASLSTLDRYSPGSKWGNCRYWREPIDDRVEKCLEFSSRIQFAIYVYIALAFIAGIIHTIMFVACLTPTYRRLASASLPRDWSSWRVPGGQISFEVTLKFLRQDLPPPRPVPPIPQPASEEPPTSD